MSQLVHYNQVGLQLTYGTPGFKEALYRFQAERMGFYKQYQNEFPFDTYEEAGFADTFHSTKNPPVFFVCSPDITDSVMNNSNSFCYMVTMFDLKRHTFTYNMEEDTGNRALHSTNASLDRPYLGFPLGGWSRNLTFKRKSDFNRRLVYYLLPQDYHYFKDFLPFYVEFHPAYVPSLFL